MRYRQTSAGGIVLRDGRMLLLETRTGQWVLPKGKVEEGESLPEAAVREVREEAGLDVTVRVPAGSTSYHFRNGNGNIIDKTVYWFVMDAESSEPRPEPTFRQARFFPPPEALRLLTFANDRGLLSRALLLEPTGA